MRHIIASMGNSSYKRRMHGWHKQLLDIDLSTETVRVVPLAIDVLRRWIGGRGLACHLMLEQNDAQLKNPPVYILAGPLVGTGGNSTGHSSIVGRCPISGGIGDYTTGGKLGVMLKRAGVDGMVLRGRARRWVGVEITDAEVRFVDASPYLGVPHSVLYAHCRNKGALLAIGAAGERDVPIAMLLQGKGFPAGRGGSAHYFSRRQVKYLTVRGSGEVSVFDTGQFGEVSEDIGRLVRASSFLTGEVGIAHFGTAALFDAVNARRMLPVDNFRQTWFDEGHGIHAARLMAKRGWKDASCANCQVGCRRHAQGQGPSLSYEALAQLTALIGNGDIEVALTAHRVCVDLGVDVACAMASIACMMEAGEWPHRPADLPDVLAGIGDGRTDVSLLGDGPWAVAVSCRVPEAAMCVKKMPISAYDPRGALGMALGMAVANRAASHESSLLLGAEILRKPQAADRFSFAGKARISRIQEDALAVLESLGVCRMVSLGVGLQEYGRLFAAATGEEVSAAELMTVGERICYGERRLNERWGQSPTEDDLPARFFEQPGTSGPGFDVPPIDRQAFLDARRRYYRIRGLDANGTCQEEEAQRLGVLWNG